MSPLSHLARRQTHIKHLAGPDRTTTTTTRTNCRPLTSVHLCSVLLIYVSMLPNLVNLTTSQTMNDSRNLSTLLTATVQSHNNNTNHFDDDLNREAISGGVLPKILQPPPPSSFPSYEAEQRASASGESNKTNVISVNLQQATNQMISSNSIVSNKYDQLEREQAANDDGQHGQHLDDLLAVESNRSPALLAHLHNHHHGRASNSSARQLASTAPYEASTKDELQLSDRDELRPRNSTNQSSSDVADGELHAGNDSGGGNSRLLSIQTVPTLTPIYLKHPLPPALRPQLVAFPHPASTRANQNYSTGANGGSRGEQGSFALLPSWPNIYITQREHTVSTTARPSQPAIVQQTDPKVPMNYPDWSRVDHHSSARPRLRLASSEVEYDQNQFSNEFQAANRRSNLTATSEVEYEDRLGQQQQQQANTTSDWDDGARKLQRERQLALDRSRQLLADSWTKLLNQAAKNNAMESLMLTNRSIVSLLCDTNNMLVRFKFKRPFYGMVETNLDPSRQCRVFGNGSHYYEMRIDLFECGTRQEMSRLFINNIQISFQADNSNNYSRVFTQRQQYNQLQDDSISSRGERTDAELDEFKTLICSYPPPNSHSLTPTTSLRDTTNTDSSQASLDSRHPTQTHSVIPFDSLGRKTIGARPEDDSTTIGVAGSGNSNNIDSFNLSERIIDNPTDEPAAALYYEPILVISGLLLLLLAIALALVSSVYMARRKQRSPEVSPPPQSTNRKTQSSVVPNTNVNNHQPDSLRFYGQSPAQLANREQSPRPVAPPLIGLGAKTNEMSSSKRRSGTTKVEASQTNPTSPNVLKHKQKQLRKSGRERNDSRQVDGSASPKKRPSSYTKNQRPSTDPSASELTNSGAPTDKSSPSELSVTTIEIPYVSSRQDQIGSSSQQGQNSSNLIRNVSSQTPTKLEKDAKSQTAPLPRPTTTTQLTMEQIKRETSHEKIIERVSYQVAEPQAQTRAEPIGQQPAKKEEEPLKRHSPVPFGSFRSRLTSPNEFRRLQNIVRLFDDDQTIPNSADLYKRYRTKIAKTISPNERRELKQLLKEDEAFRSNVVDSIDSETFSRKLRDNPRYSSRIQSKATWDLLEEVLLDANMSKPVALAMSDANQRPAPTNKASENPISNMDRQSTGWDANPPRDSKQVPYERTVKIEMPSEKQTRPLLVTRSLQHDKRSSTVVERAKIDSSGTQLERTATNVATSLQERPAPQSSDSRDQIQVTQSNSTRARCDDNTMINFDTVTNISTPRNFSAFTRSSFDLKQVTKFREHDSFPYMDD